MKTIKSILVTLLILNGLSPLYGGPGNPRNLKPARVPKNYFHMGFSCNEFVYNGHSMKFQTDYDIVALNQAIQKNNRNSKTFSAIKPGQQSLDSISASLQQLIVQMQPTDAFIFQFTGASLQVEIDTATKEQELRFFLNPIGNAESAYFTLADLKLWLDIIPAREQIIIIDAGETQNLKTELIKHLVEKDIDKSNAEKRYRTIISNMGKGIEIPINGHVQGVLSYSLQKFISQYPVYNKQDSIYKLDNAFEFMLKGGFKFHNQLQTILDSIYKNLEINYLQEFEIINILKEFRKYSQCETEKSRGAKSISTSKPKAPSARFTSPKSYAFIVGMDNYEYLDPLSNPIFDAESIDQLIKTKYGFNTTLVKNCTSNEFFKHLNTFLDTINFGPHDQLLVYIAGHGEFNERMNTGAIAFTDAKPVDENPGMNNYLQHINLINMLNGTNCQNTMVILDVCFGGSIGVGSQAIQSEIACKNTPIDSLNWKISLPEKELKTVFKNLDCNNRTYFTSGGREYVPDGTKGAHSPFSAALLNVLSGYEKAILPSSQLNLLVTENLENGQRKVPQPSYGKFGISSTTTDFIFYKQVSNSGR